MPMDTTIREVNKARSKQNSVLAIDQVKFGLFSSKRKYK